MIEQETATAVPTGSPKRRGKRNANLMLGLGLLAGFVLIAIAMPLLSSADPQAMLTSQRLKPPTGSAATSRSGSRSRRPTRSRSASSSPCSPAASARCSASSPVTSAGPTA